MNKRPRFTSHATHIRASLGLRQLDKRAAVDAGRRAVVPAYTEAFRDEPTGAPGWGSIPPEPAVLPDAH